MMIKLDMFKALPLIPAKLLKPFSSGKANLKNEIGTTVQTQLQSKFSEEVIQALKIIITVFIEGESVDFILPKIINLLPHDNEEVKRMSQYLVSEISKVIEDKNPLILSISSLHKEVLNAKGINRGNAIKTLSSIMLNSPDLLHVLTPTLIKMVLDTNAYVRKVCAIAWLKMVSSDTSEQEIDRSQILSLLQKHLFKDIPYVMGTALVVYDSIAQDSKYEFLHSTYRRICKDILQFSPFDRSLILEMLHKYAYIYLSDIKKEKKNKFYVDEDLTALCNALEKVSMTQDLPSILQAAKIVLFLEDEALVRKYINALLKLLNKTSETKYHVLLSLEQFAQKYPKLIAPHYKKFYIHHLEKMYCKFIKLRILHEIIEDWNFADIFEEYCNYASYHSKDLTIMALISIGKLAHQCPKYSLRCVQYLMNNVLGKNPLLASKSIIALSEYLNEITPEKIPTLAFCVNNLAKIESEDAKLKLINLLILNVQSLQNLAFKVFHNLVVQFRASSFMLKLRTIELGYSLISLNKGSDIFTKILNLALDMGSFDENIILRDFSKFMKKMLQGDQVKDQQIEINLRKHLTLPKGEANRPQDKLIGTLSYLTGFRAKGYRAFPQEGDIVHTSTTELREGKVEVEVSLSPKKSTSIVPSSSPTKSEPRETVVEPEEHQEVVEPTEEVHTFIFEEKELAKLNDDFFDEE